MDHLLIVLDPHEKLSDLDRVEDVSKLLCDHRRLPDVLVNLFAGALQQCMASLERLTIRTNRRAVSVDMHHLLCRQAYLFRQHFDHPGRGAIRLVERRVLVQAPASELDGVSLLERVLDLIQVCVDRLLTLASVRNELLYQPCYCPSAGVGRLM